MMVRYVLKTMKNTSERMNESASHVRKNDVVSPSSERRRRTNISVHTEAENETKRSIASMSLELKNLSRWNFVTNFSIVFNSMVNFRY